MDEPRPLSQTVRYDEIALGRADSRDYSITADVYRHFLAAFGDESPIHVDEGFATSRGFAAKVMHGALLNGFISHFIGMVFPGRESVLLAADLRYSNPSYLGDVLRLRTVVIQKLDSRQIVVLDATFTNTTRNYQAGRGHVRVMVKDPP